MDYAIITENDESNWNDITGESYHYPARYRDILSPGTKVIYYKGRMTNPAFAELRLSPNQHYFGVALIGNSYPVENTQYECDILSFQPFDAAVPNKLNNEYLEPIPINLIKNYWRNGVRKITEETFNRILELACAQFEPVVRIDDCIASVIEPTNFPTEYFANEIDPINNANSQRRTLPPDTNKDANVDWDEENKRKRIKGRRAEELVMDFERKRLIALGRKDLAEKVCDYSKRYSKGFDILSWDMDKEEERHIEVKSSSGNGFILTRNELDKSENNPNYWIYIVNEKNDKVYIKQIKNPSLSDANRFRLEPKDYYVSFSI